MAGWLLAHGRLSQPVASFPPVSLIESLGILIIGLALVAGASRRSRVVALSGLTTIALGLMALGRQLFLAAPIAMVPGPGTDTALIPLTLPVSSGLLFIFAGAGLIGLSLPTRADRSRLIAGAFGAIEVVLCLGILTTRVMWRPDVQGSLLLGSSFHLLIATLLLGLCLGSITWSSDPDTASTPWVPLTVGIACLVTAIFLWRALVTYEQAQIRGTDPGRGPEPRESRSGDRWRRPPRCSPASPDSPPRRGPHSPERENNAITLTRDVDGLLGIAWVDSAMVVRQIHPSIADSAPLRSEIGQRLKEQSQAKPQGESQVAKYFPLEEPGLFAIVLPYCGQRRCTGYVAGVFDAGHMLAPAVSDSGSGFVFAVAGGRRDIITPPGRLTAPADWTDHSNYSIGDLVWDISTWPSEQTLARQRSGLPEMLLLLGLVVSTLLPLAIRLGQLNLTRARLAERVRVNLALETATDGIWEWDVATGTARRSAALWRHLGYDPGAMSTGPDPWTALINPLRQAACAERPVGSPLGPLPDFRGPLSGQGARG